MQLIPAITAHLVGIALFLCTANAANTSDVLAYPQMRVVHSPLSPQSSYPANPIMLESPSNFPLPEELRTMHSMEDYIVGGYNRWGGYDNEMFQPDGSVILEFDMKITKEEYTAYYHGDDHSLVQSSPSLDSPIPKRKPGKKRFKRKAMVHENTHWTDGVIPYQISEYFSPQEVELVKRSMKSWEDRTCIRFVPAQVHHQNVLKVQSQRGCNSFVGMVGGTQQLNLEKDCRVKHVMIHELGHVLGLIHEHQRPDRDSYIRIMSENVGFNKLKNFRKFRPERVSNFGVEYDYMSIMHYGKKAFSKDDRLTTMATIDSRFQDIIGHATSVSFNDAKVVNLMYECAKACRTEADFCGTGYMDRNCQCVCKDGTQSCVHAGQPIRPVHGIRLIQAPQPMRRVFTQRARTQQRPAGMRNIFFPSIQRPVQQTPTFFTNLLQSAQSTAPQRPLYRNIFTGQGTNVLRTNTQRSGSSRNIFFPAGGQRSVSQVPMVQMPVAQRHVVQAPSVYTNTFQYPSQTATHIIRGQRPVYRRFLFLPTYRYHNAPTGRPLHNSGNQRYYQQPRYHQSPVRTNPFTVQHVKMVATRLSHPGVSTNTASQQRGVNSRPANNIHIYPGYIALFK